MTKISLYRWDGTTARVVHGEPASYTPDPAGLAWDFDDAAPPWTVSGSTQAEKEAAYFANYSPDWAARPPIVNLQTGGADFRTNVLNTIAANGRCIIRLPAGTFHLTSFVKAASDEMYAFGLWHTNLAGFVGAGADQTFIQMDANSMNATQLAGIATLTSTGIVQIGVMRIDGNAASPAVLCGLTVQSADQQTITSFAAGNGIVGNQPAPHKGVTFFQRGAPTGPTNPVYAYQSHVRYMAAGRACTSLPPFECCNFDTQYGYLHSWYVESDGRLAGSINAARPRRCGVMMGNNDYENRLTQFWLHHSNVSRYAVNDQNQNTSGAYTASYGKIENITETQNTDPALNGGASLGGYTNATLMGWETCNGTITIHHVILKQDNTVPTGQVPCHFQLTTVGTTRGANGPQGGRFYAYDNVYKHAVAYLDGYEMRRIAAATYWKIDGYDVTIDSRATQGGAKKTAWVYTGGGFPSQSAIVAAGISPATHYIVNQI